MMFIVSTNVVASRPPELGPTAARVNYHCNLFIGIRTIFCIKSLLLVGKRNNYGSIIYIYPIVQQLLRISICYSKTENNIP